MCYESDNQGTMVRFPAETRDVSVLYSVQTVLAYTAPPIQCGLGVPSPEVRRPGRETNYSFPSSAELNNE
jgi:hypothetical protein